MGEAQPQRKSGCSLRSVLICLLVAIGIAAALIFNFVHDLQTAERDVRAKHLEATTVIQRIYAHYNRTGKWPAEDVVEPWLPAGWNYYFKPLPLPANPPLLLRHAEYHMQLAYYFLPPQNGRIDSTWTLSIEGDKSTFKAATTYRPAP